jgi:hypothetical protein
MKPPLTNRGVRITTAPSNERDVPAAHCRCDWFKVTIWSTPGEVMLMVAEVLRDFLGDDVEEGGWRRMGPGKRLAERYQAVEGLCVLEYSGEAYVGLEVKGEVCARIGNEGVARLMRSLRRLDRWNCTRLDFAWDEVPFEVEHVYSAIRAGHAKGVRTRNPEYYENDLGQTVYTHDRRHAERFARVYNKRGYTRFEWVVREGFAKHAAMYLGGKAVQEWPAVVLEWLNDWIDFRSIDDDPNWERAARLPWWQSFVADAGRAKLDRFVREKLLMTPAGKVESAVIRSARTLRAAIRVLGAEYVLERIDYHGQRNRTPQDEQLEREIEESKALFRQLGWNDKESSEIPI